jgi:hypothetical protein
MKLDPEGLRKSEPIEDTSFSMECGQSTGTNVMPTASTTVGGLIIQENVLQP